MIDTISGVNLANQYYSCLVIRRGIPESVPTPEPEPESEPTPEPELELEPKPDPYDHLLERQYLSNFDLTAYRCKEHPDSPQYYSMEGIIESHFKPFHNLS